MILNILILEDDKALAKVLSRSLNSHQHNTEVVETIEQLQRVMQEDKTFDLILMDLKLETETSISSIQDVRQNYPDAKIFIVTGYASIATTVDAIKQGADDYLPKPITAEEILACYFKASDQPAPLVEERLSPKRLEWEHIQRVLKENDGNISKTAQQLNMHRRTLQRKLQKKPASS